MKMKNCLLFIFTMLYLNTANIYSQINREDFSILSLSKQSDLIVRGIVVNLSSSYKENGRIYSNIKFKVTDHYKDQIKDGQEIELTLLGGTVNGITMFSPEYPQFNMKEESILFLKKNPHVTNTFIVSGLKEGKYNIYSDKNGRQMIIRDRFADDELKIQSTNVEKYLSNNKAVELNLFINHLRTKLN